ncbi:MAG TPA: hypothetical protein VE978_08190 [Chitinophagales bacterium]|nr:hypothetical protein [Chitinophagales bacterium]
MKAHLIPAILIAISLTACFSNKGNSFTDVPKSAFEEALEKMSDNEVNTTYIRVCRNLIQEKNKLAKAYESAGTKSQKETVLAKARELLALTLSDSIFVCWYGTGWDFNGTTTCPRNGNIACGYFITTVLQQSGFNISRSFLAQQASGIMIKTLCPDDQIKIVTNNQTQKLFAYLKSKQDGIFIVGLDNHTGFIFKKNNTIDFIDADYQVDKVVREPLEKSAIIRSNSYFMVGDLLHSDETMARWLTGKKIGNE